MSFAKTILVGRVGREVELRFLPNGTAVASFSVAHSEKFKKDGEPQEKTYWWKISVWGRQAEVCNQYVKKGDLIYLEGRPGYEEYTSREGEKRFQLTLNVSDVQFLSNKRDSADSDSAPNFADPQQKAAFNAQAPARIDESEVPF